MKNFNSGTPGRSPRLSEFDQENLCEHLFREAGPFWHVYTQEDYPVFLADPIAFRLAMNFTALSARLHPQVKTYTFEWMSNHYHGLHGHTLSAVKEYFVDLAAMVEKGLRRLGRNVDLSGLRPEYREITSLQDFRNSTVYTNRNGYVVSPDHTPFSYTWGANRFYFNPDARQLYQVTARPVGFRMRREMFRSKRADRITDLMLFDNCICPMCFCDIAGGEALFRDAHQYFNKVSRNVESQKTIAAEIGEKVFYTDDELYSAMCSMCAKLTGQPNLAIAPKDAKIQLARCMHFDYNASNKQIGRILRMGVSVVDALFPRV